VSYNKEHKDPGLRGWWVRGGTLRNPLTQSVSSASYNAIQLSFQDDYTIVIHLTWMLLLLETVSAKNEFEIIIL
jgi:hypothetical protein